MNKVTQLDEYIYENFNWKIFWIRFGFFVPIWTEDNWDWTDWFVRRRDFKDMLKIIFGKKNPLDICYF